MSRIRNKTLIVYRHNPRLRFKEKLPTTGYVRAGLVSIEDVLPHVCYEDLFPEERAPLEHAFFGYRVKMDSLRYQVFGRKGTVCVCCGIEGRYFAVERHVRSLRYHLNLYALDEEGQEVLLTKDHIFPRARGGGDDITNLQTMCLPCNAAKADKYEGDPPPSFWSFGPPQEDN